MRAEIARSFASIVVSNSAGIWLIGIGVAALFGLTAYFAHLAEKQRIAHLTAWATSRGWSYSSARRKPARLPFVLFDQGHSRHTSDHVRGTFVGALPGLPDPAIELFQFHYEVTTGSGKDQSTQEYDVCCVVVDTGVAIGEVTVRTENLFDRVAALVGFDDIDFEDPEFSKRFHVSARDRRCAYALLEHELTDYLATLRTGFATHGSLFFVHESGGARAEAFERLAAFTFEVLVRFPRLLINTERERRGLPPLLDAGAAHRAQAPTRPSS